MANIIYINYQKRKIKKRKNIFSQLLSIILKICLIDIITLNYQRNLNNNKSEIDLVIQGSGSKQLLYSGFNPDPSQVLINGANQNSCKKTCPLQKDINNITLIFEKQLESCSNMFSNTKNLIEINFSKFDFSKVTTMSLMFNASSDLKIINFGDINTSLVNDMYGLFKGCYALSSINFSSFNTSKVTTMSYMFYFCYKLNSINLSSFNTSQVTTMSYMFYFCYKLNSINLSPFNTSQVTTMSYMFYGCSSLNSINLSSFNTSQVTTMSHMFHNCSSLNSINLSTFNTSQVTTMSYMFYGCSALSLINLSTFNTSKVKDMSYMFYGCSALSSINLTTFNTSKLTTISMMFYGCSSLSSINLSSFDTYQVTTMSYMFRNCSNLKYLNLSNFDTLKVKNITYMFNGCSSLIFLNMYSFKFDDLQDHSSAFNGIPSYAKYCISDIETKNKILGRDKISNCFDTCFQKYVDIDLINHYCIGSCENNKYNYKYNDVCYDKCPEDTYALLCDENYCNKTKIECFDKTPQGYYLDRKDQIYKKCYKNCKLCCGEGNETINNCQECVDNFTFLNDSYYNTNCYQKCDYYYYFDESNEYHCIETCQEKFSKLIKDKNKCIDKCISDDNYKYEYDNTCYLICPNGTYNLIDGENYFCYDKAPNGYYLDLENQIYEKCFQTCNKCGIKGDEYNNNCIECKCKENYTLYNDLMNISNCYEICNYYYYFNKSNEYHCTKDFECPEEYNKLIENKSKCIDECRNDNIYKYNYKNKCYQKCPEGTIINETNYTCYDPKNIETTIINKINEKEMSTIITTIINIIKDKRDKDIEQYREIVSDFNVSENKEDIIESKDNVTYQMTTTDNQKNNTNKNISTINLGKCEEKLKTIYGIDDSLPLIIFKIDYYSPDTLIPIIGYEIYH